MRMGHDFEPLDISSCISKFCFIIVRYKPPDAYNGITMLARVPERNGHQHIFIARVPVDEINKSDSEGHDGNEIFFDGLKDKFLNKVMSIVSDILKTAKLQTGDIKS